MEEQAFLRAILANPDDDAPRLVYADWLEEQRQENRAKFIRLQCAQGRNESLVTLREMLRVLQEAGPEEIRTTVGPIEFHYERGFVKSFSHQGALASLPEPTSVSEPRDYLRFFSDGTVRQLTLATSHLGGVAALLEPSFVGIQGTYTLTGLDFPYQIRVAFETNRGQQHLTGAFSESGLQVDVSDDYTGKHYRQEFAFIDHPGLNFRFPGHTAFNAFERMIYPRSRSKKDGAK